MSANFSNSKRNISEKRKLLNCKISVIGIGYVGLPLAIEFAKNKKFDLIDKDTSRKVIGFDINQKRINELKSGIDSTNEIDDEDKIILKRISFSSNKDDLKNSDVYIVTVPTPIDKFKKPDLSALESASRLVGLSLIQREQINFDKNLIKPIVIFESTVYPGATEEICIPIIERNSNLKLNQDFYCGYSPERINPGDRKHKINTIKKVTSGSCEDARDLVDFLYSSIINAGTYSVENIKIAEAAKVIENTQRDLNIALVNELALIFNKLDIDTLKVLKAAETKWNFMSFRPGLVGGHCIGVDPYYLTYKAKKEGFYPEIVLSGRKINDGMSQWISDKVASELKNKGIKIQDSIILLMGITFKENCPDTRNSKSIEIIDQLENKGADLYIVDPVADQNQFQENYNKKLLKTIPNNLDFDAIIITVSHSIFKSQNYVDWNKISKNCQIIFDLKGILPYEIKAFRL